MPRRKQPYDKPPEHCQVLRLPVELLRIVFALLDHQDVIATRATCSELAIIGEDYLLDLVQLVYKRDRFERLLDIAQHPRLSKKVRSLYFQADRFTREESFEEWKDDIRNPECAPWLHSYSEMPKDAYDPSNPRSERAYERVIRKYKQISQGGYTERQLESAYVQFLAAAEDQKLVEGEDVDCETLEALFRACPRLQSVTLAFGYGPGKQSYLRQRAFAKTLRSPDETLHSPWGDMSVMSQGSRQVLALSLAMQRSEQHLRDLTLSEVSTIALSQAASTRDSPLCHVMKTLYRFRLQVQTCIEDRTRSSNPLIELMRDTVEAGVLRRMFAAATELRDLRVHFPFDLEDQMPTASLTGLFGQTTWPKLRKLQLCQIYADSADLIDLLFRHKATLRELSLYYVQLTSGTWEDTFQQMAGQFPRLGRVRLRGTFHDNTTEWEFSNGYPRCFSPFQDGVVSLILTGNPPWSEIVKVPNCWEYKSDIPGYTEPILVHDDEGTWSDDSAESYESDDEFGPL